MSSHELAIVGFVIGIIGVGLTSWLHFRVSRIEKKRRNEQKKHFKKLIYDNLIRVQEIYKSVTIMSSLEYHNDEEIEEKTQELQSFFKRTEDEILNLVRDTKFYASMLSVVDNPSEEMPDVDKVIQKIKWLINDFYHLNKSVDRNKRRWIGLTQELQNNYDLIQNSSKILNIS